MDIPAREGGGGDGHTGYRGWRWGWTYRLERVEVGMDIQAREGRGVGEYTGYRGWKWGWTYRL